jgi:hypothetical protein
VPELLLDVVDARAVQEVERREGVTEGVRREVGGSFARFSNAFVPPLPFSRLPIRRSASSTGRSRSTRRSGVGANVSLTAMIGSGSKPRAPWYAAAEK